MQGVDDERKEVLHSLCGRIVDKFVCKHHSFPHP